jgi:hypothetical protein
MEKQKYPLFKGKQFFSRKTKKSIGKCEGD